MIKVDPMPDELCAGHEGRIKWINGWNSPAQMKRRLEIELKAQGVNIKDIPKLHLLALISGQNSQDYAKNYSMLPILRVAALDGSIQPHGARVASTYSRRLGMLVQRRDAQCCTECIAEDLRLNQFSWHRRMHQLIGIDWCFVHNSPLSKISVDNPFSLSPHVLMKERKIGNQLPSVRDRPLNDGFVRRYAAIAIALLKRGSPISAIRLNYLLAEKARTLGLRTSMSGRRKLLSDLLFEMAPLNWLEQHVSGFADKKPLQRLGRIDTILSMKTIVGTGDAYAIALAVLYESAEEALSAFQSVEFGEEPPINVKPMVRPEQFWKGDVWSVYVSSKGSIIEMAERLQMEKSYLGKKLADLGFPSLHDLAHSAKWRAFERFLGGENLQESCGREHVALTEVENLLRICSAQVIDAIRQIKLMTKNNPRSDGNVKTLKMPTTAMNRSSQIFSSREDVESRLKF